MNEKTRKGIMAGQILQNADQYFSEMFQEVMQEQKPSRSRRLTDSHKSKTKGSKRKRFDEYDD